MGSRTEPCGTLEGTGIVQEPMPLVTTDCFRFQKVFLSILDSNEDSSPTHLKTVRLIGLAQGGQL